MKKPFLGIFSAFFIFFAITLIPAEFFFPATAVFVAAAGIAIFARYGNRDALLFLVACVACLLLFRLPHSNTLFLQMAMGTGALHLIWGRKGEWWNSKEKVWVRVGKGIVLFVAMAAAGIGMNLALNLLGLNDGANAMGVVDALPIYLLVLSFTLVPMTEELFFRALLVPRIGVLASAVVFGLTHTAYGSVAEILGATLLGLLLAWYFARARDLLPCIIAHAIFNLLSVAAIKVLMGAGA